MKLNFQPPTGIHEEKPRFIPAKQAAVPENREKVTCECHSNPLSPSVKSIAEYSPGSIFWLLMGATRLPKRVRVQCSACGRIIGESASLKARNLAAFSDMVSMELLALLSPPANEHLKLKPFPKRRSLSS